MKFTSIEEFLKHVIKNDIAIADIEFFIPEEIKGDEEAASEQPPATPDVLEEPPVEGEDVVAEPEKKDDLENLDVVKESVAQLHLASGAVQLELSDDGSLLVEDFSMTPNACGTGHIIIGGRKIHLNMCEMDGKTVAYVHTSKDGVHNTNTQLTVQRKK